MEKIKEDWFRRLIHSYNPLLSLFCVTQRQNRKFDDYMVQLVVIDRDE